jgi:gas vesicle protein
MEETRDFYPHRRDDSAITNLPQSNPTYPTREELNGLLNSVRNLTSDAEGSARQAGESAQQADKSKEFAETAATNAGESLRSIQSLKEQIDNTAKDIDDDAESVEGAAKIIEENKRATDDNMAWTQYYCELAKAYAHGASQTPAIPGGVTLQAIIIGAKQYCEDAEGYKRAAEEAQRKSETAKSDTETANISAISARDAAIDAKDATLAAANLVPAIAVDVEAALEASRELIGTDGEALLAMMENF